MKKMLFLALLTLVFPSAFCYMPYPYPYDGIYPLGGMFNAIESQTVSVPDNAPELLKKFSDLQCLVERSGERCWDDYTISIYRSTADCEMYLYGGCINNQTRFYKADMCRGECRLPPSNDNAPANGDNGPNPVTPSSSNQPEINSAGAIPPPIMNPSSESKPETP